jgi:hypothetical protein
MKNLRDDDSGAGGILGGSGIFGIPPLFLLIGIVILALLFFAGFLAILFATKTIIVLILVLAGLYLLVKPKILGTTGPTMRFLIPIFLIILGLAFYSGWLKI